MPLVLGAEQVQALIYPVEDFVETHSKQFQLKSRDEKPATFFFPSVPELSQLLSFAWVMSTHNH